MIFSKFTWLYPLKHKSDVFKKFKDFQQLLTKKILAIQTMVVSIKSILGLKG
jgi:hypothetical protein